MRARRVGRPPKSASLSAPTGFQLPNVTGEMVAGVEEQIRKLQAQAKYIRAMTAIRNKYGM